jgi:hypothetical protein
MKKSVEKRNSERGSAGTTFLIIAVVLGLIGHAGYQFIPVAYGGESLKQDMQTAVIQGVAVPGRGTPIDSIKQRLQSALRSNGIPPDAIIDVKQVNSVIQARVTYTKAVPILPFGIYTYNYQFDHTATPTGFLTKQ